MEQIQMLNLVEEYGLFKEGINSVIEQVLKEGKYINGPEIKKFEEKINSKFSFGFSISCANGTDAIQIALMALDLKPEDEIILPGFTYIAAIEAVALLKLKPVLVDVDPYTYNIDPNKIEELITDKTKVIIPVHLFGHAANLEPILEIAQKYQLKIIEDNAQSLGTEYIFKNGNRKYLGGIGDIGTTSFFPTKNLGCYGDGGAIFSKDIILGEKLRMIANHGQSQKYVHDIVGCNSCLDTVQAAILLEKLKYFDHNLQKRRNIAQIYSNELSGIQDIVLPQTMPYSTHSYNQFTLRLLNGKRDEFKKYLIENGIHSMIYYPISIPNQKAYNNIKFKDISVSEQLNKEVISIPIDPNLSEEKIDKIILHFKSFFNV
ncbi:MAG: hypothetical protein RIR51_134 [Bacteroidota bacterium]|jgi:dTDP-4-amino-4,6-dideoxygalactose transaminase